METKNLSKTASVLIFLVGIWVALSPIWIKMTGGQKGSVIATGCVIALAGLVQLFWENILPNYISGLASIWLFISAFSFGTSSAVKWSNILCAIAIFILSFWDGIEVAQLHQQHHAHG